MALLNFNTRGQHVHLFLLVRHETGTEAGEDTVTQQLVLGYGTVYHLIIKLLSHHFITKVGIEI